MALRDLAAEPVRELDALVHRHTRERDERHDVDRAQARVRAFMRFHVDVAVRDVDERMRRAHHRVGFTGVGEDRAVVVDVARAVQQANAIGRANRVGQAVDEIAAPAFAHVRNALDELRHRARG